MPAQAGCLPDPGRYASASLPVGQSAVCGPYVWGKRDRVFAGIRDHGSCYHDLGLAEGKTGDPGVNAACALCF